MLDTLKRHWLRIAVHIACLIPLAVLIGDFATNNLTVNPIQEATERTGKTALIVLVLSLACSPLKTLFGFTPALALRRPLGLYAFFYAACHLTIFVAVDYGFDLTLIGEAVVEKRYVLAGFSAFLLLLPLAITSTKGWMRRLGARWKRLHRLVYVAAGLAILHYVWLVKADIREPLLYGAAVAGLLLLRLPWLRRRLASWHARRKAQQRSAEPARRAEIPSADDR